METRRQVQIFTVEDIEILRGMGILASVEDTVEEDSEIPIPEVGPSIPPERNPRRGLKLPLTTPLVLKFIRSSPRSVPQDILVQVFGEDVLPLLIEMTNGHVLKCWGPKFNMFYIHPDSQEEVLKIIRDAEK